MIVTWDNCADICSRSLNSRKGFASLFCTVASLGAVRLVRAWNQTGQKHAGEPDIGKNTLPAHHFALWTVVLALYLFYSHRLFRRLSSENSVAIAGLSLWLWSFTSRPKVRFTKADAPELTLGLEYFFLESASQGSYTTIATEIAFFLAVFASLVTFPRQWIPPGGDIKGT